MSYKIKLSFLFLAALAIVAVGTVWPGGETDAAAGPVVGLSAYPSTIDQGESTTLSWTTGGDIEGCFAGWTDSGDASGSESVIPSVSGSGSNPESVTYSMTCTDTLGRSATGTTSVSVRKPTATISVSPTQILVGQSAWLSWSSNNTQNCTSNFGGSGTSGGMSVSPSSGTHNYSITCTNSAGTSANGTATLVVSSEMPPTVSLSASPSSVGPYGSTTLNWSSSGAQSCSATWNSPVSLSGSQTTSVGNTDETHSITCTNSGGSTTRSVTIDVTTQATIYVSSNRSTGWNISPNVISNYGPVSSAQFSANPAPGGTTYSLTAGYFSGYGYTCSPGCSFTLVPGGSISISVTYFLLDAPTVNFSASPNNINAGQSTTLNWSSTRSTFCTQFWNGYQQVGTSGSAVVSPLSNTNYTIECTNRIYDENYPQPSGSDSYGPYYDVKTQASVWVTVTPYVENPTTSIIDDEEGDRTVSLNSTVPIGAFFSWTDVYYAASWNVTVTSPSGSIVISAGEGYCVASGGCSSPISAGRGSYRYSGSFTASQSGSYTVRYHSYAKNSTSAVAEAEIVRTVTVTVPPPESAALTVSSNCTINWTIAGGSNSYNGSTQAGQTSNPVTVTASTSGIVYTISVSPNTPTPTITPASHTVYTDDNKNFNVTFPYCGAPPASTINVNVSGLSVGVTTNYTIQPGNIINSSASNTNGTPYQHTVNPASSTTYTIAPGSVSGCTYSVTPGSSQTMSYGSAISFNIAYSCPPVAGPSVDLLADGQNSLTINAPGNVTLSWTGSNLNAGTPCSSSWGGAKAGSGSEQVYVGSTTTYSITCTGPNGTASDSVVVTMGPPPPCADSTIAVYSNVAGAAWAIYPGGYTGANNTVAGDQTYTISVTSTPSGYTLQSISNSDGGGSSMYIGCGTSKSFSLNFSNAPGSVDITANGSNGPISVNSGSSVTLAWSGSNLNTSVPCTASGSWSGSRAATGGSQSVTVSSASTYTITCTGANGSSVSDSVTVDINAVSGLANVVVQSNMPTNWQVFGFSSSSGQCYGNNSTGNVGNPCASNISGPTTVTLTSADLAGYSKTVTYSFGGSSNPGSSVAVSPGDTLTWTLTYTPSQNLNAPSISSAVTPRCEQAAITIQDNSNSESHFVLYRGPDSTFNANDVQVAQIPTMSTSGTGQQNPYTDILPAGGQYYYFVRALRQSDGNLSAPSAAAGVLVETCPPNLTGTSIEIKQVTRNGQTINYTSGMRIRNGDLLTIDITILNSESGTAESVTTRTALTSNLKLATELTDEVQISKSGSAFVNQNYTYANDILDVPDSGNLGNLTNTSWIVRFRARVDSSKVGSSGLDRVNASGSARYIFNSTQYEAPYDLGQMLIYLETPDSTQFQERGTNQ